MLSEHLANVIEKIERFSSAWSVNECCDYDHVRGYVKRPASAILLIERTEDGWYECTIRADRARRYDCDEASEITVVRCVGVMHEDGSGVRSKTYLLAMRHTMRRGMFLDRVKSYHGGSLIAPLPEDHRFLLAYVDTVVWPEHQKHVQRFARELESRRRLREQHENEFFGNR
jgi:hypothetical protein